MSNKKLTKLEEFRQRYKFNSGDVKWIPNGGDLLKIAGVGDKNSGNVIYAEFNKQEDESYSCNIQEAFLIWMGDFDNTTLTYKVKYSFPKTPDEILEERIIPEGFSFDIVSKEMGLTDKMNRFIPLSLHAKVSEEEAYYHKVANLWEKRDTMSFDKLKEIFEDKEQSKKLKYAKNIVAAVKRVEDDKVENFNFRISELKLKHEHKSTWRLVIYDPQNNMYTVNFDCDTESSSYKLEAGGEYLGDLKIIDLSDVE